MRGVRILGALVLAGALGACSLSSEQVNAMRDAAIANIEAWNAAGVDPLQASPELVAAMLATCTTATAILTVVDPTLAELGDDGAAFCAVVAKAAGSAS